MADSQSANIQSKQTNTQITPSEGECVGLNPLYLASQHTETSGNSANENDSNKTLKNHGKNESESNSSDSWKPISSPEKMQKCEADEVKSDDVTVEQTAEIVCPRVNCPEKIIFCFDMSNEMDKVSFRSRSGDKFAPLGLLKRAVGLFLHTKHQIDPRHEFAFIMLHHTAYWMCDFTSDPEKFMTILDDNQGLSSATESFDIADLFKEIFHHVEMPKVADPYTTPPPYVVRVLLFYGRSHCVPKISNKEYQNMLEASHHFFLDAYYIHEPQSEDNHCEEIFDVLCDLDTKGLSYVFEVSRNPTRLYDCIAQLLPHPLQRPLQKDVSYVLTDSEEQISK